MLDQILAYWDNVEDVVDYFPASLVRAHDEAEAWRWVRYWAQTDDVPVVEVPIHTGQYRGVKLYVKNKLAGIIINGEAAVNAIPATE